MDDPREKNEQFENPPAFSPAFSPAAAEFQRPKHSGLGIASFIMSIASVVAFVGVSIGVLILISDRIDFETLVGPDGELTMTEDELVDKIGPLLGYLLLYPLIMILNLTGLIFGIVGLNRPGTKKVFSVLGTVFNGLAILAFGVFVLLAIAQGNL
ncbi:hypothetical protein ACFPPD_10760 [Cohnella suwonensis]|uniref:DUF4064 domain-containing protein n=1 Tax=Cohnella suwonensis TaxID=696072 RepID=A0ABW0LTF1_9BACL